MTDQTRAVSLALLLAVLATTPAFAKAPLPGGQRWDIAFEVEVWPTLGDLQPDAGGTFKGAGLGLGGAWHLPVKQFTNSELMLGVDGFIAGTASDIRGLLDDVIARHVYVGGSLKWLFGDMGIFVLRDIFEQMGGYQDIPLMEDMDFGKRLKQYGNVVILPLRMNTSARRWIEEGYILNAIRSWALQSAWALGAAPNTLARFYRFK